MWALRNYFDAEPYEELIPIDLDEYKRLKANQDDQKKIAEEKQKTENLLNIEKQKNSEIIKAKNGLVRQLNAVQLKYEKERAEKEKLEKKSQNSDTEKTRIAELTASEKESQNTIDTLSKQINIVENESKAKDEMIERLEKDLEEANKRGENANIESENIKKFELELADRKYAIAEKYHETAKLNNNVAEIRKQTAEENRKALEEKRKISEEKRKASEAERDAQKAKLEFQKEKSNQRQQYFKLFLKITPAILLIGIIIGSIASGIKNIKNANQQNKIASEQAEQTKNAYLNGDKCFTLVSELEKYDNSINNGDFKSACFEMHVSDVNASNKYIYLRNVPYKDSQDNGMYMQISIRYNEEKQIVLNHFTEKTLNKKVRVRGMIKKFNNNYQIELGPNDEVEIL